jgi:transposase
MSRHETPAPAAWVGIDVSQHTLDACLLPSPGGKPRSASFANDAAGHAALAAWADEHARGAALGFCLESTGAYGEALAGALIDGGRYVAVVNPARVKYAGLMRGQGNKTDHADAKLIAEYATRERPAAWQPPGAEVRELQALSRRRDDLRQLAAREKTRLAAPGLTAAARRSITRTRAFLEREADRLQAQADGLIAASDTLRADAELLPTIPGVGPVAAQAILAELPDPSRFASAQQAAAFAGLAPREYRSGTSVHKRTRLSKAGNARLRKALYLPAMTAIRFNPLVGAFYERLVEAGKAKMAAVGACMRKLLMIAYGVLKSRTPFDPSRGAKMVS